MTETLISQESARLLLLSIQGLLHPPDRAATKADVLDTIRRMGALQIDTIHVVARSPYFVLWSRLGEYDPRWLEALLAEGRLFEYWSHAACFLPIEDYPLYQHRMSNEGLYYYGADWAAQHQSTIDHVLQRIQNEGPVRSADFERKDGQKGGWWNWKEEKQVLEYLHTSGRLMIARREKFQRVYDLRERVLPGGDEAQALPREEAIDELAVRAVRVLGIAQARWVTDYFRIPKVGNAQRVARLAEEGRILPVDVEGWSEPGYIHPENMSLLEWAAGGQMRATATTLLSPFDPIVWDRERAKVLFHFDYSIECYLPEAKRTYGYFSLPILHEGALIGRLDAKAYRKEGIFEVRAIYLEPGMRLKEDLAEAVARAIQRCAAWHGTPKVVIQRSEPERLKDLLTSVSL
jgi:uncharacterized protein